MLQVLPAKVADAALDAVIRALGHSTNEKTTRIVANLGRMIIHAARPETAVRQ